MLCGLILSFSEGQSFGQKSSDKAKATLDVRPLDLANLLVSRVEPEYPEKALSAKLSGPVGVNVVVGPDGSVIEAKMECGNDRFEKAATSAVKQWHFKSPLLHGQPVNIRGMAIVDFNLPGNSTQGQDFEVDSETALSHLTSHLSPEYPPDARTARIQGCVLLRVQVDEAGAVKDVSLWTGHPLLVPPTENAVRQWRYKPFLRSGVATPAKINVIVVFSMKD